MKIDLEAVEREAALAVSKDDLLRLVQLLQQLVDHGHWQFAAQIGGIYAEGKGGVRRDPVQAAYWFRRSIFELDDPAGYVGLGRLHYNGDLGKRDASAARINFSRAYEKGSADAAFYLGLMHQFGVELPKSAELAKQYYLYAIQGNVEAARPYLARIYFSEGRWINGVVELAKYLWRSRK